MKLLACIHCGTVLVLHLDPAQSCRCQATGGAYNQDGDTATIWGDGVLLGLNNRAIRTAIYGHRLVTWKGDEVLWPYPEDNGKITRLGKAPHA